MTTLQTIVDVLRKASEQLNENDLGSESLKNEIGQLLKTLKDDMDAKTPIVFIVDKPIYMLLGELHTDIYQTEGIDEFIRYCKEAETVACVAIIDDKAEISQVIEQVDGWMGNTDISEEDYNKLLSNNLI